MSPGTTYAIVFNFSDWSKSYWEVITFRMTIKNGFKKYVLLKISGNKSAFLRLKTSNINTDKYIYLKHTQRTPFGVIARRILCCYCITIYSVTYALLKQWRGDKKWQAEYVFCRLNENKCYFSSWKAQEHGKYISKCVWQGRDSFNRAMHAKCLHSVCYFKKLPMFPNIQK